MIKTPVRAVPSAAFDSCIIDANDGVVDLDVIADALNDAAKLASAVEVLKDARVVIDRTIETMIISDSDHDDLCTVRNRINKLIPPTDVE